MKGSLRTMARPVAAALACLTLAPAQAITGGLGTTAFSPVAVGVQVTPNWVLTARHVAINPLGDYCNGFGCTTVAARYDVGTGIFPANDLSLLRLTSPLGGSNPLGTPLADWAGLQVVSDLFADGTFASALNVTMASSRNTPSGFPRAYGFTTVSAFTTLIDTATANYLISEDATVHVQGGDSGGGLFLGHVTDSNAPLLGLSSALLSDDITKKATGSAFVHLAAYRTWIDETMAKDTTEMQMVNWVSAVPEPGSLLLMSLGLGALVAWKRKPAVG